MLTRPRPFQIFDAQSRPITLRPETPEDAAFVTHVYGTTLWTTMPFDTVNITPEEFQAIVQTQITSQRSHYELHYPTAEYSILLRGDVAIGRLIIAPMEKEILLADIMILPEHKRQGTCSAVMRYYVAEGLKSNRAIRLSVERWNQALHLYKREGFVIIDEAPSHFFMKYTGEAAGDEASASDATSADETAA
jgi:ribosomal protein S18 acetylase RimI-like enzyme